jgi:hypothetical protein
MSEQNPPIPFPLNPIFNIGDWIYADSTLLTIGVADARYLKKGGDTATGLINFNVGITTAGITSSNDIIINGAGNYLQFPDGTQQFTASSSINPSGNSYTIVPNPATPLPTGSAGIYNQYNTGAYAGQFYSNVSYSYINLWFDMQGFLSGSVGVDYNASCTIEYQIIFNNNPSPTTPATAGGICKGTMQLFPNRYVAQWGTHYAGVVANVLNSYTNLNGSFNATYPNYAPFGRQYYCYNMVNSGSSNADYAYLYGGASYALMQFAKPYTSGNYSCSVSTRILDSTYLQSAQGGNAGNLGIRTYISFQV